MADLADKIDDLICTFDGTLNASIDTLAMYIFGVFVFMLFVLVFAFHFYGKNRAAKCLNAALNEAASSATATTDVNKIPPAQGQKNGASATATTSAVGRTVPSSPTVRRRLLGSKSANLAVGMSPTKGKVPLVVPPSATGADVEAVQWVNSLLNWLYTDAVVVSDLAHQWIQALNETMKPAVAEHGVGVELIRMLSETSPPPTLNNIFCECGHNDDIKITCDCEATAAMQLKAFRQRSDKVETFHYRVNVNRLRSRLNTTCVTEKLNIRVKFDGWPEIKVMLAQVGSLRNNNLDEKSLQEVIGDIVSSALRNTSIDFNFSVYPSCPRFKRRPVSPARHLPLHYDSLLSSSSSSSGRVKPSSKQQQQQQQGEKLMVKIVKGNGLAPLNGVPCDQFCVVEVDNPPQTNQTKSVRGGDSPNWNEQLTFNINQRTKEIMFEVYNRCSNGNEVNTFLGLAIVSVQELIESASQRQVISLQSRPYHSDQVSGTLTLEFTFLDTGDPGGHHTTNGSSQNAVNAYVPDPRSPPVTAYTSATNRDYNSMSNAAAAAAEQTRNNTAMPNKTTLTLRSLQKPTYLLTPQSPAGNQTEQLEEPASHSDTNDIQQNGEGAGRGRTRKRRDFFGTIRKRLNRSRSRSRCKERNGYVSDTSDLTTAAALTQPTPQISRATSADRTLPNNTSTSHALRAHSLLREGSARSSLSEVSGVSGASSRTYLNESSTLVLEAVENNVTKYYLVPLSLAQKNKWKKKGTKLHIFNEHVFVAKHLAGGTACEVCQSTFPRRLGKQGYECRDCQLKCHKRCHVQTDIVCPCSSVPNLELADVLTQYN